MFNFIRRCAGCLGPSLVILPKIGFKYASQPEIPKNSLKPPFLDIMVIDFGTPRKLDSSACQRLSATVLVLD